MKEKFEERDKIKTDIERKREKIKLKVKEDNVREKNIKNNK